MRLRSLLQWRLYNTWPRYKNIGFITLYIATLSAYLKSKFIQFWGVLNTTNPERAQKNLSAVNINHKQHFTATMKPSQLSFSNKGSEAKDYYGYWQPYPTNTRARRWFQQFEAMKNGGPFCIKVLSGLAIVYHLAYYTYQFTAVSPESRCDLKHVIWLKGKWPFCGSVQMKQMELFRRRYPNQYRAENMRTPILNFVCVAGMMSVVLVLYNRYCLDARKLPDGEAVDWRLMYYLKKYVPAFRNFGIVYREFKTDDF
uniref:Uncharacterized protein n=1 Tax=Setaria digitata TaxID=48799 RepID=A0A915PVG0_9BILA